MSIVARVGNIMEEFWNRITIHYIFVNKLKKGRWEGGEWQGWERWRRRGEERGSKRRERKEMGWRGE